MRKEDAIRILKQAEPELRARGVTSLALFGSTARDEASPDSDVDVLVELDETRRMSLFDLSEIKFYASDVLGHPADVAIRKSIRPSYRDNIETDSLKVF
jgi:predicted nucleotidyltransferase